MVEFNFRSRGLWHCLFLAIIFSLLAILLSLDPPHRISHEQVYRPKLLTRQLKNIPKDVSPTPRNVSPTPRDASPIPKKGSKPDATSNNKKEIPLIYVITPTYYRLTQLAELTRMSNTLRHVKHLHWILIEDWTFTNHYIHEYLVSSNISFTYIAQLTGPSSSNISSKGIDQRNAALDWLMKHHDWEIEAVVYFADDDNAYDIRIFEEMRYTKKISMWPVGLSGGKRVERPVVKNGKVVKFIGFWTKYRTFPVDMAGFAINIQVLWDYHPMKFDINPKYCCMQETSFIEQCCYIDEIEPLADNCSKVYVWHTKTKDPDIPYHISTYNELYV